MNITRASGFTAFIAASAIVLSGCAANEGTAPESPEDGGTAAPTGTLIGAGSSAQQSAMEAWTVGYQNQNPDATVEYDPVGSGGGRETFAGGGSQFAGTDRAFNDEELEADEFAACVPGTGVVQLPTYISPIAVVFNLEGIETLNMDAATIAGIFAGEITEWTDESIASQNEGVELPDLPITAVHRADDSGTTANFTDYLAAAAPDVWTVGPIETWPTEYGGEAAPQTSGVVDAVANGTGTIGYVDASRSDQFGVVSVQVGDEYVAYSPEAAAAIVDASPRVEGRGAGDLSINLDRASQEDGVYPIVLVSYQVACNEYQEGAPVDLLKDFLSYVVSPEGQELAATEAGSAPISDALRAEAQAAIDAIK